MTGTGLSELAISIHEASKAKGWWSEDIPAAVIHMLIVTEIAEATECVRKSEPDYYEADGKPEGESVEIIDALIRILDYCGRKRWDVDELMKKKLAYNKTRSQRHGGKSF